MLVLAYGFFATRYTYHMDSLVSGYYDGDMLISAGRFSAPLISFLTNWMAFSPFWQTVLLCLLLTAAGVVYALLIRRESGNAVPDGVLYAFTAAFVSAPLMAGQLTYPNLNIGLAFLLVPAALWFTDPFETKPTSKKFAAGVLLMTLAVDLYESFAPVYLVCVFFLIMVRLYFMRERGKSNKEYAAFILRRLLYLVAILAAAIALDFALSKLICKLCTGSFAFWYSGNTTSHWLDTTSGFSTSMKKLLCCFLIDMVLSPAEYLWAFLYTGSAVFLAVLTAVFAIRKTGKRNAVKAIAAAAACVAMFASSKALDILLCRPAYITQMQPVHMFTALALLTAFYLVSRVRKRFLRNAGVILSALVILLQTQALNNYAVKNQERYAYEDHILTSVCDDLAAMDTDAKDVCFFAPADYALPSALRHTAPTNPVASLFRKTVYAVWDRVVPAAFAGFLNRYYAWAGDFRSAEDCQKLCARAVTAETPYLSYLPGMSGAQNATDNTLLRKGLALHIVPPDTDELEAYCAQTVFEKGEKYRVIETDGLIAVIFITPDF